MVSNAIVLSDQQRIAVQEIKDVFNMVLALKQDVMIEGIDYGIIPGTGDKLTLFQPGMWKVTRGLKSIPQFTEVCVIRDYDKPLFHYEYECTLVSIETGKPIPGAKGRGVCTSMEQSFRWRWVASELVPATLDITTLPTKPGTDFVFKFAYDKREIGGKYNTTEDYWKAIDEAIASGKAKPGQRKTKNGVSAGWEIDTTLYGIPNPDLFDQVNTIAKRALKRALDMAVNGAAAVDEMFASGMRRNGFAGTSKTRHDPETGEVIEGEIVDDEPTAQKKKPAWVTNLNIDKIFEVLNSQSLSDSEIYRLTGLTAETRYGEWWWSYETGNPRRQAAGAAPGKRKHLDGL
jgi:hypothetical protein